MRVRLLIDKPTWLRAGSAGRGSRRRQRQDPRKERLRRQITKVVVGLALVGTLLALVGDGGLMTLLQMRTRAADLERQVVEAERHNDELRSRIRALREDPQAIEELAREELGMARPDETIYLLPQRPERSEEARAPEPVEPSFPTGPSLHRRP